MIRAWSVIWRLAVIVVLPVGGVWAQQPKSPTGVSFDAPRAAVRMAGDIAGAGWPSRLATPSDEGQFEVLVRKEAAPVVSSRCASDYLVVRMPATMAEDAAGQAAVARKRRQYENMLAAYTADRPIHFDTFAGPYGKRLPAGKLELSGCNLFFVEPSANNR